ncbi:MAG: hypothetical protein LC772_02980 [Chloroflexi bacterium]|nr:hypothetical protein [Chloroflexota bacterium]
MPPVYNNIAQSFHATAHLFGADPGVFSVLYALSVPIFWFCFLGAFYRWQTQQWFRARAHAALAATLAPYVYLAVAGSHVPAWADGVLAGAAALGILIVQFAARRCRRLWGPSSGISSAPHAQPIVLDEPGRYAGSADLEPCGVTGGAPA